MGLKIENFTDDDLTDRRPAESEMREAVKQVLAALRKV